MVLVIFLALALPPWLRPTWLVVTAWILPFVFAVFVGAVRVTRYVGRKRTTAGGNESNNLTNGTVRLSPQAWPILITVVVDATQNRIAGEGRAGRPRRLPDRPHW